MNITYPSDVTEATADFTKSHSLLDKDFHRAQRDFKLAKLADLKRTFLNYCLAVIHQKNIGALTIREAAYVISNSDKKGLLEDKTVQEILDESSNLQRHPSNYKANHQEGWERLVVKISALRRKLR